MVYKFLKCFFLRRIGIKLISIGIQEAFKSVFLVLFGNIIIPEVAFRYRLGKALFRAYAVFDEFCDNIADFAALREANGNRFTGLYFVIDSYISA